MDSRELDASEITILQGLAGGATKAIADKQ
jgi:hypothetical protein